MASRFERRRWDQWELQFLREHYADARTADLAEVLSRSPGQVYQAAHRLGLRKDPAVIAQMAREQISRRDHGARRTAFRKGLVPWNKGLHYVAGGRSAETRFKPGRPASAARNYLPIGSLRVSKDGYVERKVTDDPTLVPARRWVAEHRLVWQAAHGPIPDGQVVVFRPGLRTTDLDRITPDVLELVTRGELMARNTMHRYPKEIVDLIQLRGVLNRKINEKTKESA